MGDDCWPVAPVAPAPWSAGAPASICSPSCKILARFRRFASSPLPGRKPPAAAIASPTRDPDGSEMTPGRRTGPTTSTTTGELTGAPDTAGVDPGNAAGALPAAGVDAGLAGVPVATTVPAFAIWAAAGCSVGRPRNAIHATAQAKTTTTVANLQNKGRSKRHRHRSTKSLSADRFRSGSCGGIDMSGS